MTGEAGFRRVERSGFTHLRCGALERIAGVEHAFFTRLGSTGDLAALSAAAGLAAEPPHQVRQVHGATVLLVTERSPGGVAGEADALVASGASRPRAGLAVRTADCVPLLVAEAGGGAIAAVHAGWRGAAAGIVGAAVGRLVASGARAGSLVAALGPAIGRCCYVVGEEVLEAVAAASGVAPGQIAEGDPGRRRMDLRLALARQLEAAGLPPGALHVAPHCTACDGDLFFSYRRQGPAGGRQFACIGWAPGRFPDAP